MSITSAVSEVISAISDWLNPSNHEKRVLRKAIEAAEQLLLLLRKQGRYATFSAAKLVEYEIHFQKQFDTWKDGTS